MYNIYIMKLKIMVHVTVHLTALLEYISDCSIRVCYFYKALLLIPVAAICLLLV